MRKLTKPMSAGKCSDLADVRFPVMATPKLDGIRCLTISNGTVVKALSKKFKPIPNRHVRLMLEEHCPSGFDGELIVKGMSFQDISSAIMSHDGRPNFTYMIFDYTEDLDMPYTDRINRMMYKMFRSEYKWDGKFEVEPVLPVTISSRSELERFYQYCLNNGYEGTIIRSPSGIYKCGKSTVNEGIILKLKPEDQSEAVVVGYSEKMHNANTLEYDDLGHAKRSSHKKNKIPMGTLGSLTVRDVKTGVTFDVGTGINARTAKILWNARKNLVGMVIKYKSQLIGVLEKPRFPVYLGLRSAVEAVEEKEDGSSMEFDF